MKVSDILKDKGGDVFTIRSNASLVEAAQSLDSHQIGALVVLDDQGGLAGMISERDIVRQAAREGSVSLASPVSAVMTRDVVTATLGHTLADLMSQMTRHRIRHLPVVEDGKLAGMVSIGDVVKRKIETAEAEAEAMKAYIASA